MSTLQTLDHQRAGFACDRISKKFGAAASQQDLGLKQYRTVVRNAPLYVRQVGLLQATAFWLSKDREAEHLLTEHVFRWLFAAESTKFICSARTSVQPARKAVQFNGADRFAFVPALLERTSVEIAVLEAEAEAILSWLSRITEGLYQAKPENPPSKKKELEQKEGVAT